MSDARSVGGAGSRPAVALTEAQQAAGNAAVESLAGLASSIHVSSHARLPSVVPLSSLALVEAGAQEQIFKKIDSLLQASGTNLQGLIEQQIPPGENAEAQTKRAKNVLLATLISLPPAEREAVMQNPARLRALCKNAIFGSLVSKNNKICAVCSSNVKKSAAYQDMSKLPKEIQPLAHQSAQRLEMLMARNPDLDEKQKESIREKLMKFFQETKLEEGVMTFPVKETDESESNATANISSEGAGMLCLVYALKFLGEDTYKGFNIPDSIYMWQEDGKIDAETTVNARLRGGGVAFVAVEEPLEPLVEAEAPPYQAQMLELLALEPSEEAGRRIQEFLNENPAERAAALAQLDKEKGEGNSPLQKLINEQPEFKTFVNGHPEIKAAFSKAGITGLDD